jgi:ribonuclease HII
MIIAGVDEAGRGSVLGPLVVAGVAVDQGSIHKLGELGVRDSKLLSAKKRQRLYREIRKLSRTIVCQKIEPADIDQVVFTGKRLLRLNFLEATVMASVLSKLNFDRAIVDCCDTNQKRFGYLVSDLVANRLGSTFTVGEKNPLFDKIKSEHHADRNHLVVSAASVIAKVTRDAAISRLHKKHGPIGSGYPSDPLTISFLKESYARSREFPSFARLSWLTVRRMQESQPKNQTLAQC